jgi:hypothetical protein
LLRVMLCHTVPALTLDYANCRAKSGHNHAHWPVAASIKSVSGRDAGLSATAKTDLG